MKTSDTINDYLKLEAYVYQYCDEHKLTDEERKIAEEYILAPAKSALVSILAQQYLKPYTNKLFSISTQLFSCKSLTRVLQQVTVH